MAFERDLPRLTRDLTEPEPIPEAGIARAVELMRSGRLFRYGEMGIDQRDVSLLEDEFAKLTSRRYCVAVNSGGAALFLALKVVGVQPGDTVLVNGFTLAPVPGAIVHAAARPAIVEIDRDYVIDLEDLDRKARETGAKVLLLSHMRGHISQMDRVVEICARHGIVLIEDCAHALCASYKGRAIGSFGAVAAFSAQTYKHLNAGEGGFLVTDDPVMAGRSILHSGSYMLYEQHLSTPGSRVIDPLAEHVPNFSMRMSALSAAILRPQLKDLPQRVERWNAIHDRIVAGLSGTPYVRLPNRPKEQVYSATSVQFSVLEFTADQMKDFVAIARARGLPIKWFGAGHQAGFTSAPRHWRYAGDQGALASTHAVLANLCDIRTPLALTDEECDLIAAIVREAIQSVLQSSRESGHEGHQRVLGNAMQTGRNT
ncbi:MAG TPA: aminotransferase class I/II-fold pyridoxal phosphate-dependent enzyme [Microvirga sp.]|jgi:dTDP-4-amino-4,6-dideoxygalactose transaminase